MKNSVKYLVLIAILCLGFLIRIYGLNWDQGHHLHPDERFLTMVSNALKVPASFGDYLNPAVSTFNPYNVDYNFFVYGTFPLSLNKLLVVALNKDHYNGTTYMGRLLSAVFDTFTILLVFCICCLFENTYHIDFRVKFFTAFLYAVAVLPIQLSHFFANDSFLCFFMTASLYLALRVHFKKWWGNIFWSALFFGCALGTKVNAIFMLPLLLVLITWNNFKKQRLQRRRWELVILHIVLFLGIAYLVLRITDPRFFADDNIFNPRLNPIFTANIQQLKHLSSPESTYPPSVQWFNTPPGWFSLKNLALYGLGPGYFLFLLVGIYSIIRLKNLTLNLMLGWCLLFFAYQSIQFVKALRYFIFLYPFFAIFTAFGLYEILKIRGKWLRHSVLIVSLALLLLWPSSFLSIYSRNHSRVEASYWIHTNIPQNSYLAEEHWDDWLPVSFPDIVNRTYQGKQMPVFHPDNDQKIKEMEDILAQADYIIFTSNRGYGAIPHLPERFPYMMQFYQDLFAGKQEFKKIKEFTSYPTLNLGFVRFVFNDDYADETFTVYDHPKVTIFKKDAR